MARSRDDDYTDEPARRRPRDDDDDRPRRRRGRDEDNDDDDPRPRRRATSKISRADLRTVAWAQKIIILCILGILATIPMNFVLQAVLPPQAAFLQTILLLLVYCVANITATVFVFILALKVYGTGTGVLMGLLTFIPCVNLIVLLIINGKATAIMKENDVRVGMLGANMSDLP